MCDSCSPTSILMSEPKVPEFLGWSDGPNRLHPCPCDTYSLLQAIESESLEVDINNHQF